MTVVLELNPEIEEALEKKAKANGFAVNVYVEKLIQKDVQTETEKSFREIHAPIHKQFEESGMSEEELTDFLEELREEIWQEKQKSN